MDVFSSRQYAENLEKTKRALIEEFDKENPQPLHKLAELWNKLLEPAGLEFDVENARIPVQLIENLRAYVRLRNTKQRISYNMLSSGMRHYLFHVGHLFLLYFGKKIERGFVLIDEPETSLFPDFLFDLMELYETIVTNDGSSTQLFVATHNPIIAAQFEPHQRIVLRWDEDGFVTAKHGVAPKGDDPNDVLLQDFGLPRLMGPAGQKAWEQYKKLRIKLRTAREEEKEALVSEAAALARSYHFGKEEQ